MNRYSCFLTVIIACLFAGGEAGSGRLNGLSLVYVVLAVYGNLVQGIFKLV